MKIGDETSNWTIFYLRFAGVPLGVEMGDIIIAIFLASV